MLPTPTPIATLAVHESPGARCLVVLLPGRHTAVTGPGIWQLVGKL